MWNIKDVLYQNRIVMQTKYFYFTLLFSCFFFCSFAQVDQNSAPNVADTSGDMDNIIFNRVESEASFPGGDEGWRKYLIANLNPDVPVNNRAKKGTYQVVIHFIVRKDGTITDVAGETSFGKGMEQEAIRVIKNGPKWKPASQNGRYVNAYRRQPITFVVQ